MTWADGEAILVYCSTDGSLLQDRVQDNGAAPTWSRVSARAPAAQSSNKYSDSSKAGGIFTGRKEGRGQPAAVAQTNNVCVVKRAVVKRAVVKRAGASRPPLLRLIT